MSLTLPEFVVRWRGVSLPERAAAHSHFLDLCEMLGEAHPLAADAIGEKFTFEKYVGKARGGKGYADVWMRDHFGWEYKGKRKDLKKAYEQLNDYREELGNPPLLVVCDLERFQVHTNFTATSKRIYEFTLDDLVLNQVTQTCPLPPLEVLHALFADYSVLRPDRTDAQVTQEVARKFAMLAERLEIEDRSLGASREQVAHFLMRLLFCLFADSIGLLPNHLFRRMVKEDRNNPRKFLRKLESLFKAMSERDSTFGEHSIKYFNGDLFNSGAVMQLDQADLGILYDATNNYDWSHVAPAVFGTLFERSLDPKRRSLIGAHYTSEEDIRTLLEPVLMRPLESRWEDIKRQVLAQLEAERTEEALRGPKQVRLRVARKSEKVFGDWIEELTSLRVLDPACGSGNFLYLSLRRMLDLWLTARNFAAEHGISLVIPKMVSPSQLHGIETEFYAHELASVVVWIGFLQWKHEHGVIEDREPILEKLTNIEHADAILRYDLDGNPYEPQWPKADFIVGNPPFLGDKLMRRELNIEPHLEYVDELRGVYEGRVPGGADLVTYWFEKARRALEERRASRCGLLATQGIRGGLNRMVLDRIKQTGDIFWAQSDRNWTLEGAMVHVSMVGFDAGNEQTRELDGELVSTINPNLTSGVNTANAAELPENATLCFIGSQKGGDFDIEGELARKMLNAPLNVNRRTNGDVVMPWANAFDVTHRSRGMYIIDFGTDMKLEDAAKYELPFEYIKKHVKPQRNGLRRANHRDRWWIHAESRPGFRRNLSGKQRYAATGRHGKHRFFVWLNSNVLPDSALCAIPRDDDYFFGVLSSSVHESWARAQGTQVRDVESGFRYTPTSCFETFPFPWSPGTEPSEADDSRVRTIADAARELVRLRNNWLNPPGIVPEELKKRTLTNIYNQRPEWLSNAHRALDEAVFAAYGWPYDLTRGEILARLLELNHKRANGHVHVPIPESPPKKAPGVERLPRKTVAAKQASK